MPRRKDGLKTREAILASAAKCFAKNGYKNTTNAMIGAECGGANSALISYYFGDKASLYAAAWEYAHSQAMQRYPLLGSLDASAPAVKKLFAIIDSDIRRRSDSANYENDIMLNELSGPTGILTDVHEKSLSTLRSALREVTEEILGDAVSLETKRLAVLSIFALCMVPVRRIQSLEGNAAYTFPVEERIEHVYRFAMAGLIDVLNQEKEHNFR